jgi:hypothetical protein
MGDTIGICVSEGVGTDEKFNNRLWRFCKTRIQTK